jgi:ERF superfamily
MTDQAPTANLAEALVRLQADLPEIKRTERADVQTAKGSFSYSYANLANLTAQILPRLSALGLSWSCRPTLDDGKFVLEYELLHVSGESRIGRMPLAGGTPQAQGSAITYARRYCLCAVTGVAPEEDDDAAAAEAEAQANRGTAQRRQSSGAQRRTAQDSSGRTAQRQQRARDDQPPLPGEDDGDHRMAPDDPRRADPSTAPQHTAIATAFGAIGWEDRKQRLAYCSAWAKRTLTSAKDLTKGEASDILDAISTAQRTADPVVYMLELIATEEPDDAAQSSPPAEGE